MKFNVTEIKQELQDVFAIYLDTDIAGDNDDRRKKILAFNQTYAILEKKVPTEVID
ncbi:MAG: hypothetical protein ACSHXA_07625 [Polaribacter sp.]|uniref:hypothetical protein n=1 Tax=Polaribacter sp. TaxID=1920175 RepID=UPI003EF28C1A